MTGISGESTSMVWPALGSRTAKEQNRTESQSSNPLPESVGIKGDFGQFRPSEQHVDGTYRLAMYDFLLVFHSGHGFRSNSCRVISRS